MNKNREDNGIEFSVFTRINPKKKKQNKFEQIHFEY